MGSKTARTGYITVSAGKPSTVELRMLHSQPPNGVEPARRRAQRTFGAWL